MTGSRFRLCTIETAHCYEEQSERDRDSSCCCSHSDLFYEHSVETCIRKFATMNNNLLTPGNPNEICFNNPLPFQESTCLIAMHAARKIRYRHPTTYRQCRHPQHPHLCVPNSAREPGKATRLPVLCISPPRREPLTDWPVFQANDEFLRSAHVSSALRPRCLETFSTGQRVSWTECALGLSLDKNFERIAAVSRCLFATHSKIAVQCRERFYTDFPPPGRFANSHNRNVSHILNTTFDSERAQPLALEG
jgi:hypothetical protein